MPRVPVSSIVMKDITYLGTMQQNVLDAVEKNSGLCSYEEIFGYVHQMPTTAGYIFELSADVKLAIEGKREFPEKRKVIDGFANLIQDIEGFILVDDAKLDEVDPSSISGKIHKFKSHFVRFENYIKLENLAALNKALANISKNLSDEDDAQEVHQKLYGIGVKALKIAGTVESYRRELRTLQAVGLGAGRDEDAELRRQLINKSRAALVRTLSGLKSRELLEEVESSTARMFQITEKGRLTLRMQKARHARQKSATSKRR